MTKPHYSNIKAICHLNSRMIFKMAEEGSKLNEIIPVLATKSNINSQLYIGRGFAQWRKDLGFTTYASLREYIYTYGMPSGQRRITRSILEKHKNNYLSPSEKKISEGPAVKQSPKEDSQAIDAPKKTALLLNPLKKTKPQQDEVDQKKLVFKKARQITSASKRIQQQNLKQLTDSSQED